MSQFEQKAAMARWIEQGDESYGEGSPSEQALRFYLDEMLDEAVRRARTPACQHPHHQIGIAGTSA